MKLLKYGVWLLILLILITLELFTISNSFHKEIQIFLIITLASSFTVLFVQIDKNIKKLIKWPFIVLLQSYLSVICTIILDEGIVHHAIQRSPLDIISIKFITDPIILFLQFIFIIIWFSSFGILWLNKFLFKKLSHKYSNLTIASS